MKAVDLKGVALLRYYSKAKRASPVFWGLELLGFLWGFLIGLFLFRWFFFVLFLIDELPCYTHKLVYFLWVDQNVFNYLKDLWAAYLSCFACQKNRRISTNPACRKS